MRLHIARLGVSIAGAETEVARRARQLNPVRDAHNLFTYTYWSLHPRQVLLHCSCPFPAYAVFPRMSL